MSLPLKDRYQKNTSKLYFSFFHMFIFGSKVDKPSKILIKTLNAAEYIELYIQNIEGSRVDDPIM